MVNNINFSMAREVSDFLSIDCQNLWWPGMAEIINQHAVSLGWIKTLEYSTSGFITNEQEYPVILTTVFAPNSNLMSICIEHMTSSLQNKFLANGIKFLPPSDINTFASIKTVQNSLNLINSTPTLAKTIKILAKTTHFIESESPFHDLSYSDPQIPFSIFVSISSEFPDGALRLSESIIHESMHVQLSLIERCINLVEISQNRHYSPWKREMRPASGILHAVYVFSVIWQWLENLPKTPANELYINNRRAQIKSELSQIDVKSCAQDLTSMGQKILFLAIGSLK